MREKNSFKTLREKEEGKFQLLIVYRWIELIFGQQVLNT